MPDTIRLYVDFSSNNGYASFDTFTFCEAQWKYSIIDKFDKVILSETNWEKLSANINAKTETVYRDRFLPILMKVARIRPSMNILTEQTRLRAFSHLTAENSAMGKTRKTA